MCGMLMYENFHLVSMPTTRPRSSPSLHKSSDADEPDMTARDRRMLKYFQKYHYVPPVRKDGVVSMIPAKECGIGPDFEAFFQLNSYQRSANNEDKFIYESLFRVSNMTMSKNDSKDNDLVSTVSSSSPRPAPAGTFVEIGAFNGMQESNTRFFEICLGWEGLLVEGQPRNYHGVLRDRPLAHKMSFAPSCDAEYEKVNKTIQFSNYPMTNSGLKGHAKTYDAKPMIDVACGPFSPVLEDIFTHAGNHINLFSLDVEGSEKLVLDTIDFSKVKVDVFMIEIANNHCPVNGHCEVRNQVRRKMESEGYKRYENLVPKSDIYVHRESPFQLPSTFIAVSSTV